jgi:hypothetical protein
MNFESADGELEMYDSRNHIDPANPYRVIRECIESFLKVANGNDRKLCKKFTVKDVPRQSDSYNCGLYVIAFTRAIMKHEPLPQSYDTVKNKNDDILQISRKNPTDPTEGYWLDLNGTLIQSGSTPTAHLNEVAHDLQFAGNGTEDHPLSLRSIHHADAITIRETSDLEAVLSGTTELAEFSLQKKS